MGSLGRKGQEVKVLTGSHDELREGLTNGAVEIEGNNYLKKKIGKNIEQPRGRR